MLSKCARGVRVATLVLGTSAERRVSSILTERTNLNIMPLIDFFTRDSWYKKDGYWRDQIGKPDVGIYDLIYNTCGKIAYDKDTSEWAYQALLKCFILLCGRRRYPDGIDYSEAASTLIGMILGRSTNKITYFIDRVFKTNIRTHFPFRYQYRMTRDPYIAFFTACKVLGEQRKIELITIPIYLYRPNTWSWHKYLKTNKLIYFKLYKFWNKFSTSKKEYVERLGELKEIALLY